MMSCVWPPYDASSLTTNGSSDEPLILWIRRFIARVKLLKFVLASRNLVVPESSSMELLLVRELG